jgi:hypothetical protein
MPIPDNTGLPTLSGKFYQTNTVTTTNGTWTNTPTSYTYQWNRNGSPIGGATASTYVVTHADEGTTLSSTVVAVNGSGSSTPSGNVGNLVLTLLCQYLTNLPKATVARTMNALGSLKLSSGRPTFGQLWPRGEGIAR